MRPQKRYTVEIILKRSSSRVTDEEDLLFGEIQEKNTVESTMLKKREEEGAVV